MPQLDKFTYFTQFFWSCLFFFLPILTLVSFVFMEKYEESLLKRFKCISLILKDTLLQTFFIFLSLALLLLFRVDLLFGVNPFHVIGQASSIIYIYIYFSLTPQVKHVLGFIFFCSTFFILALEGLGVWPLSLFTLIYLLSLLLSNDILAYCLIFLVGLVILDPVGAWALRLAFQLTVFCLLLLIFEKRKLDLFSFLFFIITIFSGLWGYYFLNGYFHLSDILEVFALIPGALIILLTISEGKAKYLNQVFFGIFIFSIWLGIGLIYFYPQAKSEITCVLFYCIVVFLWFGFFCKLYGNKESFSVKALITFLICITIFVILERFDLCPYWLKRDLKNLNLLLSVLWLVVSFWENTPSVRARRGLPAQKAKSPIRRKRMKGVRRKDRSEK